MEREMIIEIAKRVYHAFCELQQGLKRETLPAKERKLINALPTGECDKRRR